MGDTVPHATNSIVINMQLVDVDRLNRRRSSWERMDISRRKTGKGIAFEAEIDLQVFSAGVSERNLPPYCQQNWPVQNQQEHYADTQPGHHTTPNPPVTTRVCLIVFGHRATLLPPCERANAAAAWVST